MPEPDKDHIDALAKQVVRDIIDHIDTMYPQMWEGTPRTARTSLRNIIYLAVTQALQEQAEDQGERGQD